MLDRRASPAARADNRDAIAISVCGVELLADLSGALFASRSRTLVVADLHLEKGSAAARRGRMLPPYDTRETLDRLGRVIDRYRPRTVVALGDSLHDSDAALRMAGADRELLALLQSGRQWIWVRGNHDPEIATDLGGDVTSALALGALVLRHEPRPGPVEAEIAGHLHPAARIAARGVGIRRRCFVGDGQRLVLPAFGAFTGGLNVRDAAFAPLFAAEPQVLMLGEAGVYPVAAGMLLPD